MSESEKKVFSENPDSTIVFLDDDWSMSIVSMITQSPIEYSSGGASGLKYEAVKDFLRWATPVGYDEEFILKNHVQLILNLGQYRVSEMNRKK